MKTFFRTMVVFVVLNLAMGCSALAQNVSEREELEAAKEDMKRASQQMKQREQKIKNMAERQAEEAVKQVEKIKIVGPHPRVRGTRGFHSFAGRHSRSGQIFVIPTSEIKAEDLIAIVEDMKVMSRIFDKELGSFPRGISLSTGFDFNFLSLPGAPSTKAIFLQGYGVLFLMEVDFPLSPPVETEVEEEPEEDTDEIWTETRREIYEPENVRRKRIDEKKEYNEEKVEEMKETLIKALKHTTNIRNLKADESVILTVAGSGDSSSTAIALVSGANQVLIKDNGAIKMGVNEGPSLKGMDFSPTVMTIRVKKSDVDAFAKGKLDFDKFRQKVQIFTY